MNGFAAGLLFGVALLGLLGGGVAVFHRWNHRTGAKVRLLAKQYQAMTDSASRDIPMDVLAQPEFISSRMEFRKIQAIEAELINEADKDVAQKLLKEFFKTDDPWIKAQAAKVLYRLNSKAAFAQLKELVENGSPYVQLPGIWALGEMSSSHSVELLMSLAWNKNPEVQQAVIRCLVQMEAKKQVPIEMTGKVQRLLKEIRYKTDWIL